jgi:hypothetical protein
MVLMRYILATLLAEPAYGGMPVFDSNAIVERGLKVLHVRLCGDDNAGSKGVKTARYE